MTTGLGVSRAGLVDVAPTTQSQGYPPFKLGKPRYDQSTFYGRWRHFCDIVDPTTLFTNDEKLQKALSLLDSYKQGTLPRHVTDKQLWQAQKIKQAIVHPDTGQTIMMPFRMAGYVPFKAPEVVGMLLPNLSIRQAMFWQTANQSHNAVINYANRNASRASPTYRYVMGYIGAVTSAVAISASLMFLIQRTKNLSPAMKMFVKRFVPFPAVACASTTNVVLVRHGELFTGIEVVDKHGQDVGTSKVAAKKALLQTAVSRMFLPAPVLLTPPLIMSWIERTKFLRANPRYHLLFNSVVTTLCFGFSLPIALALFPQDGQIQRERLEINIQNCTTEPVLYYNKGL